MEPEALYFGENGTIKSTFHENKSPININEVEIKEIMLSHKKLYRKDSFKYFIRYTHEGNACPSLLCVKIPQMDAYAKYFDKNNKYKIFLVNDKEVLKRYSEIWTKIKSLIKKEFNSELVYNDKYIKTKIKIYNDRVYTNFQHNKIPKDNEYYTCLFVALLDSIFVNSDKEYYPQILLQECIFAVKNKNINTTNKDL